MKTVGLKALKNNLSKYVRATGAGELVRNHRPGPGGGGAAVGGGASIALVQILDERRKPSLEVLTSNPVSSQLIEYEI